MTLIKEVTGIEIYVEVRPRLADLSRKDTVGCHKCLCDRCRRRFGDEPSRNAAITGSEKPGKKVKVQGGSSLPKNGNNEQPRPAVKTGPEIAPLPTGAPNVSYLAFNTLFFSPFSN